MNVQRLLGSFVLASALIAPREATAQFESFLEKVTDVNFFFSCWHTTGEIERRNECLSTKNGYGLEVSFDVGAFKFWGSRDSVVKAGKWTAERKHVTSDARGTSITVDSIWSPEVKTQTRSVELEVALGYSQFSGFRSKNPNIELRGTVREFPSVAAYGSLDVSDAPRPLNRFSPYLGLKSGFIELSNVQAFIRQSDTTLAVYTATGKAFQVGAVYGLVFSLNNRLHAFIEQAHNVRKLQNVQWAGPITGVIPRSLPRGFDFSGPTFSWGLQMTLKPKE